MLQEEAPSCGRLDLGGLGSVLEGLRDPMCSLTLQPHLVGPETPPQGWGPWRLSAEGGLRSMTLEGWESVLGQPPHLSVGTKAGEGR